MIYRTALILESTLWNGTRGPHARNAREHLAQHALS